MKDRTAKNYSTDNGDTWVVGGKLVIEEDASVEGLNESGTKAKNQPPSTATTIGALKNDFNALLVKLKDAGIMVPEAWNLTARLAPSLTEEIPAANNEKASVAIADNVISITVDVNELTESASSNPAQGTHKWLGLGIGTGLSDVALAKYNGVQLTADDAAEAVSVGLNRDGEFILYVKADEVVETPKSFTLQADGYPDITVTINIEAPSVD